MDPKPLAPLAALEAYFTRYLSFPDASFPFVAALWTLATHCWADFDVFPYLVVTSATKRSGKTRLSELVGFACNTPRNLTAMTPAGIFKSIAVEHPTLIMDEAEVLNSAVKDSMSQVLNAGYRKGQGVRRISSETDDGFKDWDVFCPKMFVLIGDVNDTLRDRSIVLWMRRGEAPTRFLYRIAQDEGAVLRDTLAALAKDQQASILDAYERLALPFLTDRDEELWLPLFALCTVLAPERIGFLQRTAVDLSADKTRTASSWRELAGVETDVENDEYAKRLLRDVATVMDGRRQMFGEELLEGLKALDVAPWRRFRGDGLTKQGMADLLARFKSHGLAPRLLKIHGKVLRGYRREDVQKALASL